MDTSHIAPAPRHDGWTPERRVGFLDRLAFDGNVHAACAAVGLSREAAYRLRRRDALFARAWAAALVLASEHSAQVLGTRALEGSQEEVWYRGEVVGARIRYDNRLLLAHVARLDRLAAESATAAEDAARFDELLARTAGVAIPDALPDDGHLPLEREECIEEAGRDAGCEAQAAAGNEEAFYPAYVAARLEAEVRYDAWRADACAAVDALLSRAGTPSTLSTSHASNGCGEAAVQTAPMRCSFSRSVGSSNGLTT